MSLHLYSYDFLLRINGDVKAWSEWILAKSKELKRWSKFNTCSISGNCPVLFMGKQKMRRNISFFVTKAEVELWRPKHGQAEVRFGGVLCESWGEKASHVFEKKKGTSCFPQSFSCLKKLMTADLQMDNIFHVKYVEWDEEVNWQYGGNLLGYPQFSSVLDWDFPWHQPSSSWGNPHGELEPPRIFHFRTSAGWSDFRYNQQASNPQSFP